ncbi:SUKH-4 family immunity protein [Streptomyces sp. NPDC093260]|uniref:SUKH-4 family immunity protein n=1 Tax=Streptomyces sp. NPDC093260 TaxID=3155073 RepID=UPI003415251F
MSTTTCTATRPPAALAPHAVCVSYDPCVSYAYDPIAAGLDDLLTRGPRTPEAAPDPLPPAPGSLAPSLRTLLRFTALAEELASLRARLASHAVCHGPRAAAEATRRLLAALAEAADGGSAPHRKATALLRPLSLTDLAPRPGLVLSLPHRLLAQEFGAAAVTRFEEIDFPPALTHEATRRFLSETGLPEDGRVFRPADPADAPLPTLTEAPRPCGLPPAADRLIRLGVLTGDAEAVLDGATGEVWLRTAQGPTLHPLAKDVSTFTCALWLLHGEGRDTVPTTDAYDRLALLLLQALTATSRPPTPRPADWHFWTSLLAGETTGTP